jgi:1-acyl-sn-glycerol-3-phosphate acyltransferase
MLYAILKPLAVAIMRLLFRLEGRGAHHVPRQGPVLLVANHSSVLDPPLVGGMTPRPVTFMAKAELFRIPLFGRFIRGLNAYPVRREGGDPSALRLALRILENGGTLLVFPEGTRGEEGTLRPGKPGAGMLAAMSGAAVVPVYIRGSGQAWPRGLKLPRPAKVTVTFGPPLRFGSEDRATKKKDSYGAASQAMMAAIARLKDAGINTPGPASPRERSGIGEVGLGGASTSTKYRNGRIEQHGEG